MNARTIASVLLVAILGGATSRASDRSTIHAVINGDERTTILAVAAKEAGTTALLKGADEYTLFAPTDRAFLKLGDRPIGQIANRKDAVEKLLRAHLVKGKYTTAALKKKALAGEPLVTVGGESLKIEERKDGLFVGGVKIEAADLACRNGVIHILESVRPIPNK
ncbi:MAG TPA: fasciclin domain-containing protein [Gemmata sp.]